MTSLGFDSNGKIRWLISGSWPKIDRSKFELTVGKTYRFRNKTPYLIKIDQVDIRSEKGHSARILYYNSNEQSIVFSFDQESSLGGRMDLALTQPTHPVSVRTSSSRKEVSQLFPVRV